MSPLSPGVAYVTCPPTSPGGALPLHSWDRRLITLSPGKGAFPPPFLGRHKVLFSSMVKTPSPLGLLQSAPSPLSMGGTMSPLRHQESFVPLCPWGAGMLSPLLHQERHHPPVSGRDIAPLYMGRRRLLHPQKAPPLHPPERRRPRSLPCCACTPRQHQPLPCSFNRISRRLQLIVM